LCLKWLNSLDRTLNGEERRREGLPEMRLTLAVRIVFWAVLVSFALVVVLSCGKTKNYTDPNRPFYSGRYTTGAPAFNDTILAVSYNVAFGKKIEMAIYDIDSAVELRGADVIMLQEMDAEGVQAIARETRLNYIYYPSAIHPKHDRDYGNAILSKWPLTDPRKIILPHEDPLRNQHRVAVSATANIGDIEVQVYSVHIEMYRLSPQKRLDQVDSIARSIRPGDDYVIIGGDFNTVLEVEVDVMANVLDNAGLERATEDMGWTSSTGPMGMIKLPLDHIFVKGLKVIETGKVRESEASDHIPIWVTLTIPENE
jgi:endonuclease/exonuclease/phosphatase family metal-dependent hydrolase